MRVSLSHGPGWGHMKHWILEYLNPTLTEASHGFLLQKHFHSWGHVFWFSVLFSTNSSGKYLETVKSSTMLRIQLLTFPVSQRAVQVVNSRVIRDVLWGAAAHCGQKKGQWEILRVNQNKSCLLQN